MPRENEVSVQIAQQQGADMPYMKYIEFLMT